MTDGDDTAFTPDTPVHLTNVVATLDQSGTTGALRVTFDEIGRRIDPVTIARTLRLWPRTTPRPARSDVSSRTTIPRNVSLAFRATSISASTLRTPSNKKLNRPQTPIDVHVSPHPPHAPSVLTPTTHAIARPTRPRPAP
ncbi:hypothetical protein [Burkholderia ubonensis]|uniref:hypothetical protein n=1 Tax=Burkholderia ubonensis TaxID=101571 RepID=UPI0012F7FA44|nr:hypothetical protein [Burkholderia ubonensis]